jgi:hypothetical protein
MAMTLLTEMRIVGLAVNTFGRLHKSLLGLANHVFLRPKRLREPTVTQ